MAKVELKKDMTAQQDSFKTRLAARKVRQQRRKSVSNSLDHPNTVRGLRTLGSSTFEEDPYKVNQSSQLLGKSINKGLGFQNPPGMPVTTKNLGKSHNFEHMFEDIPLDISGIGPGPDMDTSVLNETTFNLDLLKKMDREDSLIQ